MKIVFLLSSIGSGGAERVAVTLCNAWVAQGFDVTLIATFSQGGIPFYKPTDGVRLRYLSEEVGPSGSGKKLLRRLLTLRRMILKSHADVVVSFLPNVNVAAIAATAFSGIPCVIGERSDPQMHPIGRLWSLACRLMYRFADTVVVQTDSVAQRIPAIYPKLKRISVIPNPLPSELFELPHRSPNTASTGRNILLSAGRLSEEKRIDRIIEAFVQVADKHLGWDLHLVGEGPLRQKLQKQIDDCGLQNGRICLLGQRKDLWKLMQKSDAFIMASAYEGFPNALLEAVAIGLPSISTDCKSGPKEISDNGKVVYLVPPNDHQALTVALDTLLGDAEMRSKLSYEGSASVRKRFSLQKILNQWDVLFQKVSKDRHRP